MEPLIVWTNDDLLELGACYDFDLELACGIGDDPENDFSLSLPEDFMITPNSVVHVDGTQWGGIVYERLSDTAVNGLLEWRGRTWHGLLYDRVLVPDAGADYNYAQGTVTECITDLITRLGLTPLYAVGNCPVQSVDYQYKRYPNGWDALIDMLASVDLRPSFSVTREDGTVQVEVGAEEIQTLGEIADGEVADIELDAVFTTYNHIIGLGKGELSQRDVIHRYANASGVISDTKTITGNAERVLIYDNPSAEHDDLIDGAIERLEKEQNQSTVKVTLDGDEQAALCDYVIGYDQRINAKVTTQISKLIVNVDSGVMTVSVEAGE